MKNEYKEFFEYYERIKEAPQTQQPQTNSDATKNQSSKDLSGLTYGSLPKEILVNKYWVTSLVNEYFIPYLTEFSKTSNLDLQKDVNGDPLASITKDGKFVAYNAKNNSPYLFDILVLKDNKPIRGITTSQDDKQNGIDMDFEDPAFRIRSFQYNKNATQDFLKNNQQSKTIGLGFTQKNLESLSNSVYRALNKSALNEISNSLLDPLGASEISGFKIVINNITPGSLTEEESFNNTTTAEISFVVQMNAIPTTEKTRGFLNKTILKNIRNQVVELLNSNAKKVKEDQNVIYYTYTAGKDDRINVVSEKYNKDNVQFTSSGTFSVLATKGQSKQSFSSKLGNALNQFNNTTNTLGFNVNRTQGGKV